MSKPATKNAAPRKAYALRVLNAADEAEPTTVEVDLYDVIDDDDFWGGFTPKQLAEDLKAHKDAATITVNINSPGGSSASGAAIYNILARHQARVIVNVDGMAFSAASIVAMAGDEINMAANAMMMIHEPWTIAAGDRDDMLKTAELLEKTTIALRDTYAARTGQDADQIAAWMHDETWMTAAEAVERGFADAITPAKQLAASAANRARTVLANHRVQRMPADFAARLDAAGQADEEPPMPNDKTPQAAGDATPKPPAAPTPEPAKTAASADEPAAPKAPESEGQKFLNAFGDQGGRWYAEGKTFDEARDLHAKALQARNDDLTKQVADLTKRLEGANAAAGSDTPAAFDGDDTGQDGQKKTFASCIRIRR